MLPLRESRRPFSDAQGFYGTALDLRQSQSFRGTILDLRRVDRKTKRVEKLEAGELSGCSSLESTDQSAETSLGIL